MAVTNYFNTGSNISVDLDNVTQVDTKPSADTFESGNIVFDRTEKAFYRTDGSSWTQIDAIDNVPFHPFLSMPTESELQDVLDSDDSSGEPREYWLPRGTLSGNIRLHEGQVLVGQGRGNTILTSTDGSKPVVQSDDDRVGLRNLTVRVPTSQTAHGAYFFSSTGSAVRRQMLSHLDFEEGDSSTKYALCLEDVTHFEINDVWFQDIGCNGMRIASVNTAFNQGDAAVRNVEARIDSNRTAFEVEGVSGASMNNISFDALTCGPHAASPDTTGSVGLHMKRAPRCTFTKPNLEVADGTSVHLETGNHNAFVGGYYTGDITIGNANRNSFVGGVHGEGTLTDNGTSNRFYAFVKPSGNEFYPDQFNTVDISPRFTTVGVTQFMLNRESTSVSSATIVQFGGLAQSFLEGDADNPPVGVTVEDISASSEGRVLIAGSTQVTLSGSCTAGDYLVAAADGKAESVGSDTKPRASQHFLGIAENTQNTSGGVVWVALGEPRNVGQTSDVVPLNTQTSTSYTLALSDGGSALLLSNPSAITLTVPPNSSVPFPLGTVVELVQRDTGQVSVASGSGVNVTSRGDLFSLNAQHSRARLLKVASDAWNLSGDLA